jgi:hypothetical protein
LFADQASANLDLVDHRELEGRVVLVEYRPTGKTSHGRAQYWRRYSKCEKSHVVPSDVGISADQLESLGHRLRDEEPIKRIAMKLFLGDS